METRDTQEQRERPAPRPRRRLTRGLLVAALASFTLPFLTVTCYGDDITISGVQAATTIDLTPQQPGDGELAREDEPANAFAIVALLSTVAAAGLSISSGSSGSTRAIAGFAAAGVAALPGLWFYAYNRTSGHAVMDVGMAAAICLLTASAWSTAPVVPRWVGAVGTGVGATMLVSTLGGADMVEDVPALILTAWVGTLVATCLGIGAVIGGPREPLGTRPTPARMALASFAGAAILGAGVVAPFVVMSQTGSASDSFEGSMTLASAYVVCVALASVAAWKAGRAIAHGRRSRPVAIAHEPMRV